MPPIERHAHFLFWSLPFMCRLSPFFLLLLAVAISPLASAQNSLGFRFGINVANVAGDLPSAEGYRSRTGFAAGFFGKIPLRHGFALQPEILYTQKGFRNEDFELPGSPGDVTAVLELTYLELPLLLSYAVPASRSLVLDLYAGPTFEFEIGEQRRLDASELDVTESSDVFSSTGLGFVIGSDLGFSLGGVDAVVGARYTRGISDMLNEDVAESPNTPSSLYNTLFTIFLGIYL